MWKQSVWSSTISAAISSRFLKPGGVLTLTGADAALKAIIFQMKEMSKKFFFALVDKANVHCLGNIWDDWLWTSQSSCASID